MDQPKGGAMDEIDELAYRVFEAFEGMPELRLEWLMVPEEPRRGSTLEMEVAATENFRGGRGLLSEVRADVAVLVEDVRGLTTEELGLFFYEELVERGGYGRAVVQARVVEAASKRGGLSSEGARRN